MTDDITPTDSTSGPVPSDSRGWAAAAHLVPIIGLGFIAPLIIWLIKKDEDPYVDWHAKEALNFQISYLIAAIVAGISIILIIGIVLLPVVLLVGFIFMIIAGVKAAGGEYWKYPINIRFIK